MSVLLVGMLFIYRQHEIRKKCNSSPSAEDNKNIRLGLNYQGLGNLDVAFAIFKKCGPTPKIISLLRNLAEDFEILNKQDKSCEIYQYILSIDPDHLQAKEKLSNRDSTSQAKPDNAPILLDGRYEIKERLGKGTDSSVFYALDHVNNGQELAVKILEINYKNKDHLEKELLARFQREAATAVSLQHKNIIQVYDSGYADDVAYMTMEFINGKSLREHSQKNTLLPIPLVTELIAQCADGLHFAHGMGIIHRDVKPANILYDHSSETAKLGDFGIARIANSTQTLAGSFLGTPFYMSPEQLESLTLDERSDIFSLGATLFRLLCGSPPFAGHSIADLMIKIVNQPHKNLNSLNPDIPDNLIHIIDKALCKDPDKRFASAQEFSQQLRNCL
ncbi:MAG: serine/threonine-protein kinase [Pseudomonadota bacterium]